VVFGRFATPADFSLHDCSLCRGLHVRRTSLGVVHRSRATFCRAVPNVTIRNFVLRCTAPHLNAGGGGAACPGLLRRHGVSFTRRPDRVRRAALRSGHTPRGMRVHRGDLPVHRWPAVDVPAQAGRHTRGCARQVVPRSKSVPAAHVTVKNTPRVSHLRDARVGGT
jgi:hypothetical protein